MRNFTDLELGCSIVFERLGPCWHLYTPEDHEIIFPDIPAFKAGMGVVGIAAKLCPEVTVITFELMSNHMHLTASGRMEAVLRLFALIKRFLSGYLRSRGLNGNLPDFVCKLREITTLDDLRNVICYNNRNGYVVNPDTTPFSYPWGANVYYFNPAAKMRFAESRREVMPQAKRRELIRAHDSDGMADPPALLDGYACPMDFCAVCLGEQLFRSASHYFRDISRNVESQKKIAAETGERLFYTDDDLFAVVQRTCRDKYGCPRPALLGAEAKTEVANMMHYEYNAGNKQIARILKMDLNIVESMYPGIGNTAF